MRSYSPIFFDELWNERRITKSVKTGKGGCVIINPYDKAELFRKKERKKKGGGLPVRFKSDRGRKAQSVAQ